MNLLLDTVQTRRSMIYKVQIPVSLFFPMVIKIKMFAAVFIATVIALKPNVAAVGTASSPFDNAARWIAPVRRVANGTFAVSS